MSGTLSIYSQYSYHEDAFLVGDWEGLIQLRDAIDNLLSRKGAPYHHTEHVLDNTVIETFAHDGEGYNLNIILNEKPQTDPTWHLHAHYTAEHASTEEFGTGLVWPADLLELIEQKKEKKAA